MEEVQEEIEDMLQEDIAAEDNMVGFFFSLFFVVPDTQDPVCGGSCGRLCVMSFACRKGFHE